MDVLATETSDPLQTGTVYQAQRGLTQHVPITRIALGGEQYLRVRGHDEGLQILRIGPQQALHCFIF